jgi:hypothetical protein
MYSYGEYAMLRARQISFLDNQQLVGTARYGIPVTPCEVAKRFDARPERSFDALGYYDFFAVESESAMFGFRMHLDQEKQFSLVSFVAIRDGVNPVAAISEISGVRPEDVSTFDENW